MLIAAVLAMMILAGAQPVAIGVVALVIASPVHFLLAVGGWALWSKWHGRPSRPGSDEEAAYLQGIAAELRSGASLRDAIGAAADRAPSLDLGLAVRLAAAGRPLDQAARALRSALAVNGRLVAASVRLASTTGAEAADLFGRLAESATQAAEVARERRALTAQARLSAFIVGGTPIAAVALSFATGSSLFSAGPLARAVGVIGIGLQLSGVAVVVLMLRHGAR
ncbi:MAG: hypothetical protein OEM22_01530 [Acidimicrobiia bacterium]|nr:hypothetical protein [Acidimicrobiia bacterium]MDH3469840.1 hypothetical protein [Acidimicrobiia bacterium]